VYGSGPLQSCSGAQQYFAAFSVGETVPSYQAVGMYVRSSDLQLFVLMGDSSTQYHYNIANAPTAVVLPAGRQIALFSPRRRRLTALPEVEVLTTFVAAVDRIIDVQTGDICHAQPNPSTFRPGLFGPGTAKPELVTVLCRATRRATTYSRARHANNTTVPGWSEKHGPCSDLCQTEHSKSQNLNKLLHT
jgi:hypothetical protein